MTYDPVSTEKKWQKAWHENNLKLAEPDSSKPKFFIHFAYPGPSGFFHVGHMRGYTYTDVIARIKRMKGYNVLFPVGMHATGNPAVGFATKVRKKLPAMMEYLAENGLPEEKAATLETPEGVVQFFAEEYKREWKSFGILADYDRFTCTTWPDYQKFIEWQFKKLKEHGLLVQKPYYATFCIKCGPVAVDPSETDISKGGNARKEEYVALKFKLEGSEDYLIAVTLRPETVYGQTNLWVDPEAEYTRVRVGKENWIVCKQAAEKLTYQKENVKILGLVDPKELLGKKAMAPGVHRAIPILPAHFIDLEVGTGIVTSVPSDAPDDYIGLRDLWENPSELERYGMDAEEVNSIKLIPIIKTPEYSDTPAKDVVEELGVKNQFDREKLEEAKKIVYSKGFHTGVMNENCGKYAGMPVNKAKDIMKQELLESGEADTFWDLSEEVICRCGSRVVIKKVEDQWFIKYSDPKWKENSKAHAKNMRILPSEYYESMPQVIDWYDDRACTRMGTWLGTHLPFDQKWIIEPISDSTLYPIMYVLSKYTNTEKLKPEHMTEELLDYLLLGKGHPEGHGIPKELAEEIRKEFEYWYPVDLNVGGKEHKTVHFPVYVMNHVAVLKPEHWPKGIFVHWWLTGKGSKISKSKGGASTSIPVITKRRSVDALRLYYCHASSPFVDLEFDENVVKQYEEHLQKFYALTADVYKEMGEEEKNIDKWLESRINQRLAESEEGLEEYNFKKALDMLFFGALQDLAWYQKRGGNNKRVFKKSIETLVKSLSPFTPHLCEEVWHELGNENFVFQETWPEPGQVDKTAASAEEMIQNLLSDFREVLKLVGKQPNKVTLLVAPEWKRTALAKARELPRKDMMKGIMQLPVVREKGKEGVKYAQFLIKHLHELPEHVISEKEEKEILKSAADYLSKEFKAEVTVLSAEESENPKARNAVPMKPAMFLE